MKIGFIILAHENLDRVEQLARHLSEQGSPACIHIDNNVPDLDYNNFTNKLSDLSNVVFTRRISCEWGRFSIVKATLEASEMLLNTFEDVTNVLLISGSCLPIRPMRQLSKFLVRNAHTDYIESVSVQNNFWVKGGLNEERFTLYFPFSWRNQRWLFDKSVDLQRKLQITRKVPDKLVPHIGSQWWCLTAKTLRKILDDPRRQYYDAYFRAAWIPDESYFQTLARLHSNKIESRSLTFSKFDFSGKPFNFYDDQLDFLTQSDCFFARKIWAGADALYEKLLDPKRANQPMTKANPKALNEAFEQADQIRCEGGEGRFHQGRFPRGDAKRAGVCESEFSVFVGFKNLYEKFPDWLKQNTSTIAHGSIFRRGGVGGREPADYFYGNLPAEPAVRNRNTKGYLSNFLWEHRAKHQSFLYDFQDNREAVGTIAFDPKARVFLIRHSWLLLLLNRKGSFEGIVATAKRFHRLEQDFLDVFENAKEVSNLKILDLETAIYSPALLLSQVTSDISTNKNSHLQMIPNLEDLDGLDSLVRRLRNKGLKIKFDHARTTKKMKSAGQGGFAKPYVVK